MSNLDGLRWLIFTLVSSFFLLSPPPSYAQQKEVLQTTPSENSQEPYVYEQLRTNWRFENDGNGQEEIYARIRVQSQLGVQALGQLVFNYNAANDRLEIKSLRVLKPDGEVVRVGADAVQELTAPLTQAAPMYTDLHQKHVTIPSLGAGDVIEYDILTHSVEPLASGQFWMEWAFTRNAVVLDEQLDINVPGGRAIHLKTQPEYQPTRHEEGGRQIYHWETSHKTLRKETGPEKKQDEQEIPAVQLSSFQNWQEVGRWYAGLERDRRVPSPRIQTTAAELTQGAANDSERIHALYDYVARKIRYVSLSFGIGRYQPHSATEVLANRYGDCKDKATLLDALLEVVGVKGYTALISSTREIDPDIPSPGQFNHAINFISHGDDIIWLDSTVGAAPFRVLLPNLRKKVALVLPPDGAARLETTPEGLPFPALQTLDLDGKVDSLGKLNARVIFSTQSDLAVTLRTAFLSVPPERWKELTESLAAQLEKEGKAGISDIKTSDPADTRGPFRIEASIAVSGFFDWSKARSELDMPVLGVEPTDVSVEGASSKQSLKLGGPIEQVERLKLEFPTQSTPHVPVPIHLERDYAEYRSFYRMDGDVLVAEWHLWIRKSELPASRADDYAAFRRAVVADQGQKLLVDTHATSTPSFSSSTSAQELYDAGLKAFNNGKYDVAAELFESVVGKDAKFKGAWNDLGRTYLNLGRNDKAVEALQRAIEINPYDEYAFNNLGRALRRQRKYDDAAQAFQKQIEINPLDRYAHSNLGQLYLETKKYELAAKELETAASITPDDPSVLVSLGRAYLNLDQSDKAMPPLERAMELAPNPTMLNNVAYELAKRKVNLDRAERYATSAINSTAPLLRATSLDHLSQQDIGLVNSIAAFWDTLGWVKFQQGEAAQAERYVRSAWRLTYGGEGADHLGQIYEKQGHASEAIHAYEMALAAPPRVPMPETRERLAVLLGSESKIDEQLRGAGEELSRQRTLKIRNPGKVDGNAEFWVLLAPGPKTDAVLFISGDGNLRTFSNEIRSLNFPDMFPDATDVRIVRRGILSCSHYINECAFVLISASDVHTVN